jgi:hypothetical protein
MRMPTYRRTLARSRSPRVAWTVAWAAARAGAATLALAWEAACSTGQTGGIETTVAPAASGVMSGSGAMNLEYRTLSRLFLPRFRRARTPRSSC